MLDTYISGSQAVIFLYDITNAQSFEDVADWYQTVRRVFIAPVAQSDGSESAAQESAQSNSNGEPASNGLTEASLPVPRMPIMALVGNKMDLEHMRAVKLDRHEKFAGEYRMSSHFASARTGESVDACFELVACRVLGIKVDAARLEQSKRVIVANIEKDTMPPASGIDKGAAATQSKKKKSSICVVS